MTRLDAPATARNREPILAMLSRWIGSPPAAPAPAPHAVSAPNAPAPNAPRARLRVLEIASGTGQHAVFFAERLPHLDWQPSDVDPDSRASIEAWRAESELSNVAPALALDACASDWGVGPVDAIFNANMIHISPWRVAEGLFAGAGRVLVDGGLLFLYGPFRIGGRDTAPSNAAFDADLRRRNPEWGVRDLERVVETAAAQGLVWLETNAMPANNQLVVFRRVAAASLRGGRG